jgi:hypothetical protein
MIFSCLINFETPYGDGCSNNHPILRFPKDINWFLLFLIPVDLKYFIQFSPSNKGFRNMF